MHPTTATTQTIQPSDKLTLAAFKDTNMTYGDAVAEVCRLLEIEADEIRHDFVREPEWAAPFAVGWQSREPHTVRILTPAEIAEIAEIEDTQNMDDQQIGCRSFRRHGLLRRAGARCRELFDALRTSTLASSKWDCPICSTTIAAPIPRCLPWEPLAPPPTGWRCKDCTQEETNELARLDRLRQAITEAEHAADYTGNSSAITVVHRLLGELEKAPEPRTPEGKASRSTTLDLTTGTRARLKDLSYRARLIAFAEVTPSIYRKSDPARLPAPAAYRRAVEAVLAVAKPDADTLRAIAPHDEFIDLKRGTLFWGNTGEGKTRALFASGRALIANGIVHSVRIVDPTEIKAAASSGAWSELRDELMEEEALIVDDLSHARFSEAYASALLKIIECITSDDLGPLLLVSVQCMGAPLVAKWAGRDTELIPTAEAIARRLAQFLVPIEFRAPKPTRLPAATPNR